MENDIPQNTLLGNKKGHYYLKAFLIPAIIAIVLFLPFIIMDKGYFLYYGDFNVQQIPFYQMIHDSIQNGNFGWSNTTDLGADIVGSYSFYMIASPFFWLTMLFPSPAVPHLMGPLYVLKFACCSLSAFVYLKRYVKNKDYAVIGGILYAFSGFGVYNVFFNHFHEAMITFPLLLAAVDEIMYTGRKGVLVITAFLSCTINYYFFAGQAVFAILYWLVKLACGDFEFTFKKLIQIIFEAVLGFAASAFIFLPTLATITENPRISNSPSGWSALLYGWEQRYMHIIESFFFPPDLPARPNFTPDSNAKWASVAAYLPMFSMVGVFSFMKLRKKKYKWLKYLLPILFLCALVPILNSAFQLFNASYYARWYYMPILLMCLMTAKVIAENKDDLKKGFVPVCVVCAIFIGIGLLPTNENGVVSYGKVPEYIELYYIQAIVTIVMIIMLGTLIYVVAEKKLDYMKIASAMTAVAVVICMTSSIVYGVSQGTDNTDYINRAINGGDSINMDKLESGSENYNADNNFYRIDTSENVDNWCMFWKLSSMRCFHSVVSTSIMDFYSSIGQTRDVASRMETKVYPLRSLFSVKYYFNELTESERKGITEVSKPETLANLYGFEYVDTQNGFNIYENKYYVPMGFTYDYYCLDSDIQKASEVDKTSMLMKALVLTPEQAAKYNNILSYYSFKGTDYSTDQYYQNCLDRRANSCSSFSYDSYGFNAKIDLDKDNLVFFSVPYDDGWSAKVNGQDVEIEKVDYGFMAVLCPAGSNDIQFTYETKGLFWGKVITAVGFGSLIVYLGAVRFTGRKKKEEAQPVEKNA